MLAVYPNLLSIKMEGEVVEVVDYLRWRGGEKEEAGPLWDCTADFVPLVVLQETTHDGPNFFFYAHAEIIATPPLSVVFFKQRLKTSCVFFPCAFWENQKSSLIQVW